MKTIISLLLLLILNTSLLPQNNDKPPGYNTSSQLDMRSFMNTPEAYRSYETTNIAAISSSFTDEASTANDTLSRRISSASDSIGDVFSLWYQFSIISSDTVQLSTDPAFPQNNMLIILPDIPFVSPKLSPGQITNWYYKIYGTGTSNTYWSVFGQ